MVNKLIITKLLFIVLYFTIMLSFKSIKIIQQKVIINNSKNSIIYTSSILVKKKIILIFYIRNIL